MRKIRKESEAKGRTEGLKEGVEKGLKEGRTEGRTEGLAEGLRKAIVTTVRLRFPGLTELAQQRVAQISKPEKLNLLVDKIAEAPDEDTARLFLDLVAA
jgi:flagellar biosynthesis/type III secretory pathway protein FliH